MKRSKISLGITFGDLAGVGPEVIYQALQSPQIDKTIQFVLYGDQRAWRYLERRYPSRRKLPEIVFAPEATQDEFRLSHKGKISRKYGALAVQWIRAAVGDAMQDRIQGFVTGPIHKEACHLSGFRFKGHTDFIAHLCHHPDHAMAFYAESLKVILVTHHLSLKQAIRRLTTEAVYHKIALGNLWMQQCGVTKPHIKVAGLNPHAGENGAFGQEEKTIIAPAIRKALRRGLRVTGPYPPDTVFGNSLHESDTLIVAMTHDQGLIPFKMVAFHDGVNVTIGLPLVRTSPDHGTAFDIAWQGKADASSMGAAIKLASRMARRE